MRPEKTRIFALSGSIKPEPEANLLKAKGLSQALGLDQAEPFRSCLPTRASSDLPIWLRGVHSLPPIFNYRARVIGSGDSECGLRR